MRFDPQSVAALCEIVALAFNLDHQDEALRYAMIMAERDPTDTTLLRRLALQLTEDGDVDRALRMYEQALTLRENDEDKRTGKLVIVWMEMGRLYFVKSQYDQAAHYFGEVNSALANPQENGLDATMQRARSWASPS